MSMAEMDDEALEAALLSAVSGCICQGSSVEDGVCSLFLLNAPGAPHGWGVQLTAKPGLVEAYFCSDGGACGVARSDPEDGNAYESFLEDPVGWSMTLWEQFSTFTAVRWRIAGVEMTVMTA